LALTHCRPAPIHEYHIQDTEVTNKGFSLSGPSNRASVAEASLISFSGLPTSSAEGWLPSVKDLTQVDAAATSGWRCAGGRLHAPSHGSWARLRVPWAHPRPESAAQGSEQCGSPVPEVGVPSDPWWWCLAGGRPPVLSRGPGTRLPAHILCSRPEGAASGTPGPKAIMYEWRYIDAHDNAPCKLFLPLHKGHRNAPFGNGARPRLASYEANSRRTSTVLKSGCCLARRRPQRTVDVDRFEAKGVHHTNDDVVLPPFAKARPLERDGTTSDFTGSSAAPEGLDLRTQETPSDPTKSAPSSPLWLWRGSPSAKLSTECMGCCHGDAPRAASGHREEHA